MEPGVKIKIRESDLLGRVYCSPNLMADLKIIPQLNGGPAFFNKFMLETSGDENDPLEGA